MAEALAVENIARLRGEHERVSRDADKPRNLEPRRELPTVEIGGCFDLANAMEDLQPVHGDPPLYQGQVIVATGHPGHGKSTTFSRIAFDMAMKDAGLIGFVSAEDVDGTRKRFFGEAIQRKLDAAARETVNRNLRWVHPRGITSPSVIREYIEEDAGAGLVRAVFLDTGPAMFAGDNENDNVQQQQFINDCRVLTELPGRPCVVVFWHPVKNAGPDNLIPRGGSALLGAVDGNLTIWHDADANIATLARSPWKWRGDHFEPLHFRFEAVPLVLPSGKPASIKVAVPLDAAPAPARGIAKPIRRDVALDALAEVISEVGQRMTGTSTIPPGVKAVTLEQWRTRWALRTGYTDSGADSIRNNFNKDKDALLKAGRIGISAPYVWNY